MAYTKNEIINMLATVADDEVEKLRQQAYSVMLENCGSNVYLRGLIEFSNICTNNCNYCGIRKSNHKVHRYQLNRENILQSAIMSMKSGFGSVVLQSGQRQDAEFVGFVCSIVREIKQITKSEMLPNGVGITLSVGEQSEETYRKFFDAGAHRYLLRIESSNPELYAKIHPGEMKFENRLHCLEVLKKIGYQIGTGVMIGLPGQTLEDLANDILFFKSIDADMIGMGPFIPHKDTPMNEEKFPWDKNRNYRLGLNMIAATRLVLEDVNIASTTSLQAIAEGGREHGLMFGANVIMPQQTCQEVRNEYLLYDGKPFLNETIDELASGVKQKVEALGRKIAFNTFGDPLHFFNRGKK
ncbi:MAG: [FeFe] hydrogenase H-cluster radical SAM maturase HydE [Candidatus Kapabacteria bacterium]|nr:[FeFe] hydrogenase H-cluster radical SAM maturase HydE [Candidatus Kapabacteria bacterium]